MSDTPSFPKEQEPSSIRRRRYVEAARIAETKFPIRCERAVMMIARTGCDTRAACNAVGLRARRGSKAEVEVKALCDERGIARRYFWGVPAWNWKTETPHPVIVKPRKQGGSG
jgi:hypothetical protein